MASTFNNNRCKLLVLDLDTNTTSIDDLRRFFTFYGPVQWIEIVPESTSSAVIHFVSYLIVERLINCGTCLIDNKLVRLRRFRLDQSSWHIDSHTLHIKLATLSYTECVLTEPILYFCFRNYQAYIKKLDVIDDNQAFISFTNYDFVDQILLMHKDVFAIDDIPLVFERMTGKIRRKSRWDQPPPSLANVSVLSERDPIVHKLISHIELLTKQLREQPSRSHGDIERLEAEVFILKNENAQLKSKQELSSNKSIEQRLLALEDISNRLVDKRNDWNRRERSSNNENQSKRRRNYKIHDDHSDDSN